MLRDAEGALDPWNARDGDRKNGDGSKTGRSRHKNASITVTFLVKIVCKKFVEFMHPFFHKYIYISK